MHYPGIRLRGGFALIMLEAKLIQTPTVLGYVTTHVYHQSTDTLEFPNSKPKDKGTTSQNAGVGSAYDVVGGVPTPRRTPEVGWLRVSG